MKKATVIELDAGGRIVWQSGDLKRPTAVAAGTHGERLVADQDAGRVRLFSSDGTLLRELQVPSPADAEFLRDGHLLVTSSKRGRVIEFDRAGREVWQFAGLTRPRDADRLANGNTLISDSGAHRVIEVDPNGKVVWSFSKGLLLPSEVAEYGRDAVLIADYNRHTVYCIDRDGRTRWRFNEIGHPNSLAVLADRSILVSAEQAGMLVRFDAGRHVLGVWRPGHKIEALSIAPNGNLLLALSPWRKPGGDKERFSPARAARALCPARKRSIPASPWASPLSLGGHSLLLPIALVLAIAAMAALLLPGRYRAYPPVAGACLLLGLWLGRTSSAVHPATPAGGGATQRHNLVLILTDSLRRDHVPWYGYWRDTTPRLRELATDSLVFDQYITQSSWTKPSVASLFTSTYASNHGATSQKPDSHLPASLVTLAEVLRGAGYYTAAVMENPHMGDRNSAKGFDQGFTDYRYLPARAFAKQLPALSTDTAIDFLDHRPGDRPFFLMIFYLNPHYPYEPKKPVFGAPDAGPSNPGGINPYDGEIYEADAEVGRLLDALRLRSLMRDTLFIFSTDHGEEFADHGPSNHGTTLYDCLIRVPLLIHGLGTTGRFPGLVREIDLMPTLLDYLEVTPSPQLRRQMQGTSIREFIERGAARTGLTAYAETQFNSATDLIAERSETFKTIVDRKANRAERYNLREDEQEYNNLLTREQEPAQLTRLQAWVEKQWHADQGGSKGAPAHLSDAEREQMRALGYLQAE